MPMRTNRNLKRYILDIFLYWMAPKIQYYRHGTHWFIWGLTEKAVEADAVNAVPCRLSIPLRPCSSFGCKSMQCGSTCGNWNDLAEFLMLLWRLGPMRRCVDSIIISTKCMIAKVQGTFKCADPELLLSKGNNINNYNYCGEGEQHENILI
jgi:hypothetical protein